MNVLITGATGFIGSHLAETYIKNGYRVSALIRKNSRLADLAKHKVELIEADYSDVWSLENAVKNQDYVFHLAAAIYAPTWEKYYQYNCQATENLLNACLHNRHSMKRFVFVSSISAIGPGLKGQYLNENHPCQPISDYGRSKLAAEKIAARYQTKIPITIIRPSNIIGPRQREFVNALQLIKKGILPKIGNGDLQTMICYVDDLVAALMLAADKDQAIGQTYCVSGFGPYAWEEMIRLIALQLGKQQNVIRIPYAVQYGIACLSELIARLFGTEPLVSRENLQASRKYYWLYDQSKIVNDLHFVPHIDLPAAINKTLAYYGLGNNDNSSLSQL
jgi:nucleoside-diphosphate-sugar epimerase